VHVSARVLMGTKVIRAETARADASEKGTRDKPRRKGDRLIDFLKCRVVIVLIFCRDWIVELF
jgi:hypothetical protein